MAHARVALAAAAPLLAVLLITTAASPVSAAPSASSTAFAGRMVLTATSPAGTYAPTYTGNGLLGIRVPAVGQGYAGGSVPSEAELAGFYAQPKGDVQQRASIPTWSTLTFRDGGQAFDLSKGRVQAWRQTLDLRTGVITTMATWTAPDGHRTDLRYDVFTDRAQANTGVVRLQLTPHWSGAATVDDVIDGSTATLTTSGTSGHNTAAGQAWETVRATGTGLVAGLASTLQGPGSVTALANPGARSVGQQLRMPVTSGHSYTVTKYVGVADSQDAADPAAGARSVSRSADKAGFAGLLGANNAAWMQMWNGRIDVLGNPTLATEVNASEFALWSSTRAGLDWSISPAGLSSNGYDGHIFWDAETWMYPSLLAQHPDLAAAMNAYRFQRLSEAKQHAEATGWAGARFPWESALDGTEQIPPPVSVNSEGLYEQHITSDIALAQWQYFLALGDRNWLATQGWPVISGAAEFWASRATRGSNGAYHLKHVTGPDEENPDVTDEAYTNTSAATTLTIATAAAAALGKQAPSSWAAIAKGLVVAIDTKQQVHPEYAGYYGQLVKQADVTMLQYPWQRPMPAAVAQNDLNYYVPRSDPGGPSMSDAINSIDTAALNSPGCSAYVYTQRSIEPFIRDAFDQFSETRTGGAFTFITGTGGFLQEFLYGYSGLRWTSNGPALDPGLAGGMSGLVLHGIQWHGRSITVAVGASNTTVTLDSGNAMPLLVRGTTRTLSPGTPLRISTRRPDLAPTSDAVRCQAATATSAASGADPLAAVDGSPATDWQPASVPATISVPVAGNGTVRQVSLLWGRQFPPQPKPNVHPPAGPVKVLRASAYTVQVTTDGTHWRTVAAVHRTSGESDTIAFAETKAKAIRIQLTAGTSAGVPLLEELTATG